MFNSWARSSYSFDKKLKSIEKKLIIVKNREGLNSAIYCDLLSEKNFLLNDKVSDYGQTRLYLRETEIAFIFREGSVAGVCCIPKVYQRNQVKGKSTTVQYSRSQLYPVFLIAEFDCKYFCHATEVLTYLVLQLVIS